MEFSKKIVVWALCYATASAVAFFIAWWAKGDLPSELVALTTTIVTGVIITYSGKAGVENYQKIKQTGTCKNINQEDGYELG